jgi:aminoglycoside 3-N-acetyltransferase
MIAAPSVEAQATADLLGQARVPRDGLLFVHAAFRDLGRQGLRAEAFVEGLMAYMAPGTLAMPAMSWRIVTPSNPFFDELETPSHVGLLAELFRRRYAARRSLHPTHSVTAWGRLLPDLVAGHHVDDTPCSVNSPYGKAMRGEAHILMLGIGLERVTAIHHAEETMAPEVYLQPPEAAETYQCRTREGIVQTVRLRRHLRLNRDFPQFAEPLREQGLLREGSLLGTRWMAVAQCDLMRIVLAALERDKRSIIAPPGAPVIP